MDNENTEERFDRLAKAALQQLCTGNRYRTLKDVCLDVDRNQAYSHEEKELFKERLDHAILFCNDFEYISDGGQADYGSFLHLACRHKTYLVWEVVHEKTFGKNVDWEMLRGMMGRKSRRLRRTPLHEAVGHEFWSVFHLDNLCLHETDVYTVALDKKDCDGMTPLHVAALAHNAWTAELLGYASKHGHGLLRVVYATDSRGRTPADLAIEEGEMLGYVRAVLSLTYSTSLVSKGTTKRESNHAHCRLVFEVQKSTLKKLFEMKNVQHVSKGILTEMNDKLNHAMSVSINARDLPTQHAPIDRESDVDCDSLRAEEVLDFMLELRAQGCADVELQFDNITEALKQAVFQDAPRMIETIYELSSPSNIRRVRYSFKRDAFFMCSNAGSVDAMASICSKDPSTAAILNIDSLSAVLQQAVQNKNSGLVATLCAHSSPGVLRLVATSKLIAVLEFSWMHHTQGTIPRLFAVLPKLKEIANASFSRQTSTVQVDFLLKELDMEQPDTFLVAMCTTKEAVNAIPKETCDKIAGLLMDKRYFLLNTVSETGLLHKLSQDMKCNVLFKCAEHGLLEVASTCVEAGALRGLAEKSVKLSPVTVAKNYGHDRLARMLQKALDDQNLLKFSGDQPVDSVLIRVGGPPGAGKSTLVESLKQTRLRGAVRKENQHDEGDRNYLTRTKGIKVHVYKDKDCTTYHILDLGGHEDFAAAHHLFIGQGEVPVINTIVISSLCERVKMLKEMKKWCAFYASRCPTQQPAEDTSESKQLRQPVIVVATRLGEADSINKSNVIDCFDRSKRHYGEFLDFLDEPLFVDARKSWSKATRILREHLAKVKHDLLCKGDLRQPALSGDIQQALPHIRKFVKGPLILRSELLSHLGRALSSRSHVFDEKVLASHEEIVDAVLRRCPMQPK